jgi:hypothetical protein
MIKKLYTFVFSSLLVVFMYATNAAEMDHSQHMNMDNPNMEPSQSTTMDHSQHMNMDHSTMQHAPSKPMKTVPVKQGQLQRLSEMPASGKGREAGYDGRYAMEATSVNDDLQAKCAKATRGLVMIDNKTWAQCGGKPKGWSEGPDNSVPMDHSQHMMH